MVKAIAEENADDDNKELPKNMDANYKRKKCMYIETSSFISIMCFSSYHLHILFFHGFSAHFHTHRLVQTHANTHIKQKRTHRFIQRQGKAHMKRRDVHTGSYRHRQKHT